MAAVLYDLYIYLGRRDKSGVRILAKVRGYEILPTRLSSLDQLGLPSTWTASISQVIYDNRMLWEPWVETAESYEALKTALRTRGYTNVPMSGQPEFSSANLTTPVVNQGAIPKKKLMVRRNS